MKTRILTAIAVLSIFLALPATALGWHPLTLTATCDQGQIMWVASTDKAESNMNVEFSTHADFSVIDDTFLMDNVVPGGFATDQFSNGNDLYVRWQADHKVVTHGTFEGECGAEATPTPEPTPTPARTPGPTSTPHVTITPPPTATNAPVRTGDYDGVVIRTVLIGAGLIGALFVWRRLRQV